MNKQDKKNPKLVYRSFSTQILLIVAIAFMGILISQNLGLLGTSTPKSLSSTTTNPVLATTPTSAISTAPTVVAKKSPTPTINPILEQEIKKAMDNVEAAQEKFKERGAESNRICFGSNSDWKACSTASKSVSRARQDLNRAIDYATGILSIATGTYDIYKKAKKFKLWKAYRMN